MIGTGSSVLQPRALQHVGEGLLDSEYWELGSDGRCGPAHGSQLPEGEAAVEAIRHDLIEDEGITRIASSGSRELS